VHLSRFAIIPSKPFSFDKVCCPSKLSPKRAAALLLESRTEIVVEARALGCLIEAVHPVILLLDVTRFYKIHIVTPFGGFT